MKITVIEESGKKISIPIPNALIFSSFTRSIILNAISKSTKKKSDLDELDLDNLEDEYENAVTEYENDKKSFDIDPKMLDKILKELQKFRKYYGSFVLVEVETSDGVYVEIVM